MSIKNYMMHNTIYVKLEWKCQNFSDGPLFPVPYPQKTESNEQSKHSSNVGYERESNGCASSSLKACTLFDVKNCVIVVLLLGYVDGGSEICKSYYWSMHTYYELKTLILYSI